MSGIAPEDMDDHGRCINCNALDYHSRECPVIEFEKGEAMEAKLYTITDRGADFILRHFNGFDQRCANAAQLAAAIGNAESLGEEMDPHDSENIPACASCVGRQAMILDARNQGRS